MAAMKPTRMKVIFQYGDGQPITAGEADVPLTGGQARQTEQGTLVIDVTPDFTNLRALLHGIADALP